MSLYNDQSPLVPGEYAVGPRSEVHFRALLPNKRYPFPTPFRWFAAAWKTQAASRKSMPKSGH